jgi:hypothetical protein
MGKLCRVIGAVLVAALIGVREPTARILCHRLLASWHDQDPGMRMVAEVIASAFSVRYGLARAFTLL